MNAYVCAVFAQKNSIHALKTTSINVILKTEMQSSLSISISTMSSVMYNAVVVVTAGELAAHIVRFLQLMINSS